MQVLRLFTIVTVLLVLLTSAVFGYLTPLSPDEAHYALYGTFLDWSYFDHPPLVGWVQSLVLNLGDHEFILRLPAIAVSLLTGWLLFRWVRQTVGDSEAWLVLLLFTVTPMFRILGLAWVPEVPLILVGLMAVICTSRLNEQSSYLHWLTLGICLGLAALSKYTAITLAISVAWFLILRFGFTRLITHVGFWLMGLSALLLVGPILYWNWQNDWISFLYQINHGAGSSQWELLKAIQMQLGQIGTYGLLLYISAIGASIWAKSRPQFHIHLIFAWPILMLFSLLSAKGRSLPHWTALGFIFLLPVISAWVIALWHGKHRIWIVIAGLPSVILTISIGIMLTGVNLGYPDFKHPLQDLTGWKSIAAQTKTLALADDPSHQQIFIQNWSFGSRYAWYARPLPVKILDTRVDQFDLWFGTANKGDSGYLVLHKEKGRFKERLLDRFEACHLVLEYNAFSDSVLVNQYIVYRCDHHE